MRRQTVLLSLCVSVVAVAVLLGMCPQSALAVSLEEEVALGAKIDAEILKEYPLSTDTQALDEINRFGQLIVKNVRRPEINYHFRILKDDDLNAFSVPGGYVYFSDHLWYVFNRDERTGVLAHEIVHVDRRHALDAISKAQRRQIWTAVLLAAVGANQTWGNVADLANSLYTLKYSRGDERQADEVGVELIQKAGENPAGILLAMRKIKRFQDERGGEPTKILSSHPPTKERLDYLHQLLTKQGIAVPPDTVGEIADPNKVGTVTSVSGDRLYFNSTKPLNVGDVVWLMGSGWDYKYENRTMVPIARCVVKSAGSTYSAQVWVMSTARRREIAKGASVYAEPVPKPVEGAAVLGSSSGEPAMGRIVTKSQLGKLDRFLAVQTVWDREFKHLINGSVGYLVITDPKTDTGYVAVPRSEYAYAPMAAGSTLVTLRDTNSARWVGPIISTGRSGGTIEVMPNRPLDPKKTYEVLSPAWDESDSYEKRIAGTAQPIEPTDGKIVLKMATFAGGWDMDTIENGFDLYEQAPSKDSENQDAGTAPKPS